MNSPLTVCEWMQNGMLHAEVSGVVKRPFSMGDVAQFARENAKQFSRPDRGKLRVLIVNSDVQSASRLIQILDTLSETTEAAAVHSAFDAGRRIADFRPDVVLIESQILRQESLEICRLIKSEHATRHVRVVAVLDPGDHDHKQRMLMAGADSCLDAPISNKAMLDVMGLCLEPRLENDGSCQKTCS
ncbi:MAG: response regulator [Gammaproteobacteria bacterium]|nr:response regulator [Gammaproteobacteria bacterium]